MSNGVKIGLLIVIAAALGILTMRIVKANHNEIGSRPATEAGTNPPGSTVPAPGLSGARTADGAAAKGSNSGELSQSRAKTTVVFEKTEHDFGTIKQGESAETVFRFTNTGKEPLIIENAQGSCGCTVPQYPKDPIPPGGKGEISVKFNSAGKSNAQSKTVTITANTDPSITSVLTIKAFVNAPETDGTKPANGLQKPH